jgi:hypothetical protein
MKHFIVVFFVTVVLLLTFVAMSSNLTKISNLRKVDADPYAHFDTIKTDLHDYIWPTDASRKITSSFAEYRSTHFHGGIDISTNGQKGQNVFAVRDGYVFKVRITPNGYGKMLFIKHPDGYVSTYAHLQGFNEEITKIVREEQYKRGTYTIDISLEQNQLPVKKGDIVAYSGDSGVGPPHLHFELRDENLNPINPLLFDNYLPEDNISPRIRRVMIAPLDFSSSINKSPLPKYFSRFPKAKGKLTIPQTLYVSGKIGIAVNAFDRTNNTWSKSGIHRLELYLDDSLSFAAQLDRVPAEETKQIMLHYDLPSILSGKGQFQKLYCDIGNVLPFYEKRPEGSGVIEANKLSPGIHSYRIVCRDLNGNESSLEGKILVNHKPVIEIEHIDEEEITLSGKQLSSVVKYILSGRKTNSQSWKSEIYTRRQFEIDGDGIVLPVNTSSYDIIKVVAETENGVQSSPAFYVKSTPTYEVKDLTISLKEFGTSALVSVSSSGIFTTLPVVTLTNGFARQTVSIEQTDLSVFEGMFGPADSCAGKTWIEVLAEVNGHPVEKKYPLDSYLIPARLSGSIPVNDALTISYDSNAVYAPLFVNVKEINDNHDIAYAVSPEDVLMNKGITFSLAAPPNAIERKLGLYFRANRGWIFQTAELDNNRQTFSTRLERTLGELALLQDNTPPTIGRLKVQPRGGNVYVQFRYHDYLSGVDPDEIKVYIDDMLIIPEIDGEHHRVWYQADDRLEKGKHTLRITMKDMMKNETSLDRVFLVR